MNRDPIPRQAAALPLTTNTDRCLPASRRLIVAECRDGRVRATCDYSSAWSHQSFPVVHTHPLPARQDRKASVGKPLAGAAMGSTNSTQFQRSFGGRQVKGSEMKRRL